MLCNVYISEEHNIRKTESAAASQISSHFNGEFFKSVEPDIACSKRAWNEFFNGRYAPVNLKLVPSAENKPIFVVLCRELLV